MKYSIALSALASVLLSGCSSPGQDKDDYTTDTVVRGVLTKQYVDTGDYINTGNISDEFLENSSLTSGITNAWSLIYGDNVYTFSRNIPDNLFQTMRDYKRKEKYDFISFGMDGGWFLQTWAHYACNGIPQGALDQFRKYNTAGTRVKAIAFAPGGGWVMLVGINGYHAHSVATGVTDKLKELNSLGVTINDVAFSKSGYWSIIWDNSKKWGVWADGLLEAAENLAAKGSKLKKISYHPDGGWLILYGFDGWQSHNIPKEAADQLHEANGKSYSIDGMTFPPSTGSETFMMNDTDLSSGSAESNDLVPLTLA